MNENPGLGPEGIHARARIANTTRRKLSTTRSKTSNPITQYIRDEANAVRPPTPYERRRT